MTKKDVSVISSGPVTCLLHDAFDVRALGLRHHGAEHVDGDGVEPRGAGREGEAGLDHAGEVVLHREVAIDAGGDLEVL